MQDFVQKFEKSVPFDPGFSQISFSFIGNIEMMTQEYNKLKASHQKKFWLVKFEPTILDLINKSTAFYLGCLLWGGFIYYRFKDDNKEIVRSSINKMSEEEIKNLDCAVEVKAFLNFINSFDRDCKYFLKRPAKFSPFVLGILNSYVEFARINNNFIGVENTNDVKPSKAVAHFDALTDEQLDSLCEKIYATIESKKIENLLDIGFYHID